MRGAPRRTVHQDVLGLAGEPRRDEPPQEPFDRRFASMLTAPRGLTRKGEHGVVGVAAEECCRIPVTEGLDVAADLVAYGPLVHRGRSREGAGAADATTPGGADRYSPSERSGSGRWAAITVEVGLAAAIGGERTQFVGGATAAERADRFPRRDVQRPARVGVMTAPGAAVMLHDDRTETRVLQRLRERGQPARHGRGRPRALVIGFAERTAEVVFVDRDVGEHQRAHALEHGLDRGVLRVPLLHEIADVGVAPLVDDALQPCVDVTARKTAAASVAGTPGEVRGEVVHRPRRTRRYRGASASGVASRNSVETRAPLRRYGSKRSSMRGTVLQTSGSRKRKVGRVTR